jgi:hypothetical protein
VQREPNRTILAAEALARTASPGSGCERAPPPPRPPSGCERIRRGQRASDRRRHACKMMSDASPSMARRGSPPCWTRECGADGNSTPGWSADRLPDERRSAVSANRCTVVGLRSARGIEAKSTRRAHPAFATEAPLVSIGGKDDSSGSGPRGLIAAVAPSAAAAMICCSTARAEGGGYPRGTACTSQGIRYVGLGTPALVPASARTVLARRLTSSLTVPNKVGWNLRKRSFTTTAVWRMRDAAATGGPPRT